MGRSGFCNEDKTGIVEFEIEPSLGSTPTEGHQVREELGAADATGYPVWTWKVGFHRMWRFVFEGLTKTHFEALMPFFRKRRCMFLPDVDQTDTEFLIRFTETRWDLRVEVAEVYTEISFEELA